MKTTYKRSATWKWSFTIQLTQWGDSGVFTWRSCKWIDWSVVLWLRCCRHWSKRWSWRRHSTLEWSIEPLCLLWRHRPNVDYHVALGCWRRASKLPLLWRRRGEVLWWNSWGSSLRAHGAGRRRLSLWRWHTTGRSSHSTRRLCHTWGRLSNRCTLWWSRHCTRRNKRGMPIKHLSKTNKWLPYRK